MEYLESILWILGILTMGFTLFQMFNFLNKKLWKYTTKGRKIIVTGVPTIALTISLFYLAYLLIENSLSLLFSIQKQPAIYVPDGILNVIGIGVISSVIISLFSCQMLKVSVKELLSVMVSKSFRNDFSSPIK